MAERRAQARPVTGNLLAPPHLVMSNDPRSLGEMFADLTRDARMLIQQEIQRVNRSLLEEPQLHGAQIRRFLMLHKELDPDDQEITRTRKVRRGFIAQKYEALVEALYSERDHVSVEAKGMPRSVPAVTSGSGSSGR